ncbi:hypothetical protein [Sinorhizobium sp. BJ1]|uniref:HORMA-1 domain-containing protein n=1 Tax=Sinorhizobium sp. BJ1 TaxID=2035455 RepID=UPI000BE88A59|nr:hypothetical protein [Sinorhizobium sp. BJ1]PDT80859.1 hypothetical protein CO676_25385 [Sinorhizobium sp. BJ1]
MSQSYTVSISTSFTLTHAKHMAAKVATDLKRLQRLYGAPSDDKISTYEEEVVQLLKAGYLGTVTYGFKRQGEWIEPTVRYTAHELALGMGDDDPGRIRPGANVNGATFYSYLTYNPAWDKLSPSERDQFKKGLPLNRGDADEPSVAGYFSDDRTYSAGGRSLNRASVRSF